MALVPGAGSVTDGDRYRFLRRRLRVFCTMLVSLFFAMASLSLVFSLAGFHPDGSVDLTEWLRRYWKLLLLTISLSASAALLWRRPPRTVGGLRIIELVVIGTPAIYMLQLNALPFAWDFLVEAGQQPSPRGRMAYRMCYTMMVALQWFFILTLYGTFIPNTWRRCANVVAVLAMRWKTPSQSPGRGLAEKPHGGIPGAVFALQQPAPVRRNGQGHPHRHAQGAGQVGHGRITVITRSRFCITAAVSMKSSSRHRPGRSTAKRPDRAASCSRARALLQAEEPNAVEPASGANCAQRDRAEAIPLMLGIALPGDADLESVDRASSLPPVLDQRDRRADRGLGGMVASVVPKIPGRLNSGAWTSKSGSGVPWAITASMPGQRGQERGATAVAGHDHRAAPLLDQRRIADELDRVAQSLLGVQQDGPSARGSRPRAAGARGEGKSFALPAPFDSGHPFEQSQAQPEPQIAVPSA